MAAQQLAAQCVKAGHAAIYILAPTEGLLYSIIPQPGFPELEAFRASHSLAGQPLKKGLFYIRAGADLHPHVHDRTRARLSGMGLKSVLAVPLLAPVGVARLVQSHVRREVLLKCAAGRRLVRGGERGVVEWRVGG